MVEKSKVSKAILDWTVVSFPIIWFQKGKLWRYVDDVTVTAVILRFVKCLTVMATCVWLVAIYIWYVDHDIFLHHVSIAARQLFREERVALTAETAAGFGRRLSNETTCESQCKVFVEKLHFLTRHICMEAGVILHEMINYSIFKWVWCNPAANCTLSLFLLLVIFVRPVDRKHFHWSSLCVCCAAENRQMPFLKENVPLNLFKPHNKQSYFLKTTFLACICP